MGVRLNAGDLRHRITIQQPTSATANAYNERTDNWSTWATVWAKVEPLEGREAWAAAQAQSEVTHKVVLRYLSGVTPRMRIVFGSRILQIVAVKNIEERSRVVEIEAVEVV